VAEDYRDEEIDPLPSNTSVGMVLRALRGQQHQVGPGGEH